jgi:hypothetical protein
MPIGKAWREDPEDPTRHILRLTNNTIYECTDLVVIVPSKNRSFTYPGPLAVNAGKDMWNTPLATPPDVNEMIVYYTSILGIAIREPLL